MPGGQSTSCKSTNKDKPKPVNTVQTLLSAKVDKEKDKDKPKASKTAKRTHSDVSNDSNNSMDLSNLMNFQKDIDEIKTSLEGVTRKKDLDEATKDLIRTSDLEHLVSTIVHNLLEEFKKSVNKKIEEKVNIVKNEMQEKIDAMSIENEDLKRKLEKVETTTSTIRKDLNYTCWLAKQSVMSANYNEQYSRKNNVKVFNFPKKQNENLRTEFISKVNKDLNVKLEERDVVAIHRLPSTKPGPQPVIVRLFNSDVKRNVMKVKKNLKDGVRFVDDVTKRNLELMSNLRNSYDFESVWYFNCGIYGRTAEGLQLKFGLYDDIGVRLKKGK